MITDAQIDSNESTPHLCTISSNAAIDAPEDRGLVIIKGRSSTGIFKKSNVGLRNFSKIRRAPLLVSILMPIIKRHKLGIMLKDDFIPSLAPLMNTEK